MRHIGLTLRTPRWGACLFHVERGGLEPAASEEPCSRAPARPSLHVSVGAGGTRSTIRPHVPLRARALAWPGRARRMTRATRRRALLGAPSLFHVEQGQGAKLSASAEVCPWAPHLARGLSSMARVGAMRVATGAAAPPRVTPAGSMRAGLARHVGLTPRAVRGASRFTWNEGRPHLGHLQTLACRCAAGVGRFGGTGERIACRR